MKQSRDEVLSVVASMREDLRAKEFRVAELCAAPNVAGAEGTGGVEGSSPTAEQEIKELQAQIEHKDLQIGGVSAQQLEYETPSARYDVVSAEVEEVSNAFQYTQHHLQYRHYRASVDGSSSINSAIRS